MLIQTEHADLPLKPMNQSRHVPTLDKEAPELPGSVFIHYNPEAALGKRKEAAMLLYQAEEFIEKEQGAISTQCNDVWKNMQGEQVSEADRSVMEIALWEIENLCDNDVVQDELSKMEGVHAQATNVPDARLPLYFGQAKKSKRWPQWKAAMDKQMEKLLAANTWKLVEAPVGRKIILANGFML